MPTPTETTAAAANTSDASKVQQAPRTAQEFQFAHRLLRKLVQDSTFFPVESAQRDYVWFPPRGDDGENDAAVLNENHDDTSSAVTTSAHSTNNHVSRSAHSDENNNQQSHAKNEYQQYRNSRPPTQPKRQRRRRRTVSTPLFLDYCLRSYTAANQQNNTIHRRHSLNNNNNSANSYNINTITEGPSSLLRPASPLSFCSFNSKYSHSTVISTTADDDESDDNHHHHHVVTNHDGEEDEVVSKSSGCNSSVVTEEEMAVHPMVMAELSDGSGALTLNTLEQHDGNWNNVVKTTSLDQSCASKVETRNEATNDETTQTVVGNKHVVHCIHEKNLEFGKILGSGGFGQVRLARIKNDTSSTDTDETAGGGASSTTDATNATPNATPNAASIAANATTNTAKEDLPNSNNYYAMKYLSPQKMSPPPPPFTNNNNDDEEPSIHYVSKFERGIADLAMEARYLSILSHENIVTLWYVSEGRLEEVFNCRDGGDGSDGKGKRRRRRRSSVKHYKKNSDGSSSNSNNHNGIGNSKNDDKSSNGQGEEQQQNSHHHQQHGYFLLLDALHETLHNRISHSYIPQAIDTPLRIYYPTNKKSYSGNNTHIAKGQLAQRLMSLKSIAVALVYLHEECNLIYRDLKPSNIGFYRRFNGGSSCTCGYAERGADEQQDDSSSFKCTCNYTDIPKLFDFGLAKELKSKFRKAHPDHSPDDPPTFKLTSATGSRRYMSPEVALRQPYNHKADVYSFGMVLYQISALVVPFQGLAMKNHEQIVAREGLRPDVTIPSKDSSVRRTRDFRRHYSKEKDKGKKSLMLSKLARCVWPEGLNELIAECWDDDMRKRPEMREVIERLDVFIDELNQDSSTM